MKCLFLVLPYIVVLFTLELFCLRTSLEVLRVKGNNVIIMLDAPLYNCEEINLLDYATKNVVTYRGWVMHFSIFI